MYELLYLPIKKFQLELETGQLDAWDELVLLWTSRYVRREQSLFRPKNTVACAFKLNTVGDVA